MTPPGDYLHRTCPSRGSGQVNVPKTQGQQQLILVLQRELWVKLTHDTNLERGSVVSSSFIFTNPPEDMKTKKNLDNFFNYYSLIKRRG